MADPTPITFSPAPDVPFDGCTETFFNYDTVTATAGTTVVRGCLPAHIGHIPAGKIPALYQADGTTPVSGTIQFDKLSTFTDGSVICQTFRMLLPETLAAGASKAYKWKLVTGTRNTTQAVTIANIVANTDIKLKAHGGHFGANTFTVSLNDILTNFSGGQAPIDFGANPLGGWETTESGPVVTTVDAWRYLKRDSDGASHRWVRARFHWSFLSAASGNVKSYGHVRLEHSNILGPTPSGTVGPTTYTPTFAGIFDLYNGSTLVTASDFVGSVGGSTDPATFSVATSGISLSGGALTGISPYYSLTWQVTSSGAMPSGLTSGGIYYINGGYFYPTRFDMSSDTNRVMVTSVGSGTLTFTVMGNVSNGCGFVMRTTNGSEEPIWLGTSGRPAKVSRFLDRTYLLRGARVTYPRDPSITISSIPSDLGVSVGRPNQLPPGIPWDLNTTGDDRTDVRIGELSVLSTVALYRPQDNTLATVQRSLALCWADYQAHYLDEARGRRTVGNHTTYSNLGPARPNMNYLNGQGYDGFIGYTSNGYYFRYGSMVDGSHMPVFGKGPYLVTGDDIYLEMVLDQYGSLCMAYDRHMQGPTGTWHYSVVNISSQQVRAIGWGLHLANFVRKASPDQNPETAHYRDNYKSSSDYYLDCATNNPANAKAAGIVLPISTGSQMFFEQIYNGGMLMAYWMGLESGFVSGIDMGGYKNFTNLYLPEYGGRMFNAGLAVKNWTSDGSSNIYSCVAGGIKAVWAASWDQATGQYLDSDTLPDQWSYPSGAAVAPEGGPGSIIFNGIAGNGVTDWASFPCMCFEMADVCGLPNARLTRERWRARLARNGGFVPQPYLMHAPVSWAT